MTVSWDDPHANHIISNGGLTVTDNGKTTWDATESTFTVSSGKHYWEIRVDAIDANRYIIVGAGSANVTTYPGQSGGSSWGYHGNNGSKYYNGAATSYGSTFTTGDIIGIALDMDNGKIWFAKNNVWQASGNPAAGTNPAFTGISGSVKPSVGLYVVNNKITGRFLASSQSYYPPTGFTSLEVPLGDLRVLLDQPYKMIDLHRVILDQLYPLTTHFAVAQLRR